MKTKKIKSYPVASKALHNCEPAIEREDSTPAKSAPATVNSSHAKEQVALVEAKIDVGLGNALFIRGEGEGLSWERGTPLTCIDAAKWVWSTQHAKDRKVFKLLLNDQIWAQGEDAVVEPGRRVEIVPHF